MPGLLAKDGAEGVQVAALPDGRALAVKVADGGGRARTPVTVAALRRPRRRHRRRRVRRTHPRPRRTRRPRAVARGDLVTDPDFQPLDGVVYGRVDQVTATIRRIVAENPSKFTYRGTGTYIVGHGEVAVIDPGPILDSHRDALAAALEGERVTAIRVTHCHSDHSPLAAWLHAETGAPTIVFGPHPPPDDGDEDTRRGDRRRREGRGVDRPRLRPGRPGDRR